MNLRRALISLLLILAAANHASAQGFSPKDAEPRLQTPTGLTATLFAAEPLVRQPIFVKFDPRGRLWTIQYLQYPNPAGLKRVSVDRWSRTTYDRIPEPPPNGPRGADIITLLEDTDGDGHADKSKDVIEGLNLCTGLEFGHGGLFVLQVPYLLFYPDRDHDDVPDSDPEVLLTGFGMEDAQSLVNHLTWGPDGWLYGVTGSTSTNRVRDIEFQQGVWRYHPRKKTFELFCEGGSNLFGLTFDARGQMFFSSNGGQLCYHGLQGAYYAKSFGKHGALHNPFAYGWFEEIAKRTPQRGGPSTGGTIYLGGSIPSLQDRFVCGDFLGHTVSAWSLTPTGGTFEADRVATVLNPQDTWSGPTDVCIGPAGQIYVSDFYDRRTAHPDPDAEWDRSNGRIYRIAATNQPPVAPIDFHKLSANQLIESLAHSNHWHRRQARLELATRQDPAAIQPLKERLLATDPQVVQEAFWTLLSSNQLDLQAAERLLDHESPDIRFCAIRALGDEWPEQETVANVLADVASKEGSSLVLTQLLATSRRLPAAASMKVLDRVWSRSLPQFGSRLRWPFWWAIEAHCVPNSAAWIQLARREGAWSTEQAQFLLPLLTRRLAAEAQPATYAAAAQLLSSAPEQSRPAVMKALDQGLAERVRTPVTTGQGELFSASANLQSESRSNAPGQPASKIEGPLAIAIADAWRASRSNPLLASLALQAGVEGAAESIARSAVHLPFPEEKRLELLASLDRTSDSRIVGLLLPTLDSSQSPQILIAILKTLSRYESAALTACCIELLKHPRPTVREAATRLLLSRRISAKAVFAEIEAGRIPAANIPVDEIRRVSLQNDPELDVFIRKHWGAIQAGTPELKLAEMRRLNNDLRAFPGNPQNGKALFKQHCAACHKLFGDGGAVGPDLTTTSRADREFLLRSLVDPNAVIRSQYLSTVIATTGGQIVTGLIAERDNGRIVLIDSKAERQTIPLESIESMKDSDVSIMPEGVLSKMSPQEVRDLFAYLQSPGEKP
jgi:putative membrane-bound dehydrogenase-like protein